MSVPVFQRKDSEVKFVYNAFELDCWANSDGANWSTRKRVLRDKIIRLADEIYENVDEGNETEKGDTAHREERLRYFEKALKVCKHLRHELSLSEQIVHESKTGKKLSESYWKTWMTYVDEEVALLMGVQKKESKELKELLEPTESKSVLKEEVV